MNFQQTQSNIETSAWLRILPPLYVGGASIWCVRLTGMCRTLESSWLRTFPSLLTAAQLWVCTYLQCAWFFGEETATSSEKWGLRKVVCGQAVFPNGNSHRALIYSSITCSSRSVVLSTFPLIRVPFLCERVLRCVGGAFRKGIPTMVWRTYLTCFKGSNFHRE